MKKRTKWLLAVLGVLLVAGAAFLVKYLVDVDRYQAAVAGMRYQNTDASGVPDGTYTGECDVQFIYARVSVTVQSGRIAEIELLEHRHDRGEAATGIEQRIVQEQRVDVDAVAGATNSSTVIKKAVDNALSSANEAFSSEK